MYLLIIGAPRSGTTLLASMIGMHSDVAMLIEDRWFSIRKLTGKKVLANKLCIPIQLELKKRATYYTRVMKKLGWLPNHTVSKFNIEDYLKLEEIKIIAIIREGSDVINSIIKRGKKEKKIAEERWNRAIEIIHELNTNYPQKIITLSYEDLVNNPESLLKRISDFMGIDFQEQMLEGYKHNILYPGETGIDRTRAFKSKSVNGNEFTKTLKSRHLYDSLLKVKIDPSSIAEE